MVYQNSYHLQSNDAKYQKLQYVVHSAAYQLKYFPIATQLCNVIQRINKSQPSLLCILWSATWSNLLAIDANISSSKTIKLRPYF